MSDKTEPGGNGTGAETLKAARRKALASQLLLQHTQNPFRLLGPARASQSSKSHSQCDLKQESFTS